MPEHIDQLTAAEGSPAPSQDLATVTRKSTAEYNRLMSAWLPHLVRQWQEDDDQAPKTFDYGLQGAHRDRIAPYSPPYASPLEEWLAQHLDKHLRNDAELRKQVAAKTSLGVFVLDFVATLPDGTRIGLECDGRDFHSGWRDAWRDAAILRECCVDAIVRMKGSDLYWRAYDVVYLLTRLYPTLITDRGHAVLERQASDTIRNHDYTEHENHFVWYVDRNEEGEEEENNARAPTYLCLSHKGYTKGACRLWVDRALRIQAEPRVTLDEWAAREEAERNTPDAK